MNKHDTSQIQGAIHVHGKYGSKQMPRRVKNNCIVNLHGFVVVGEVKKWGKQRKKLRVIIAVMRNPQPPSYQYFFNLFDPILIPLAHESRNSFSVFRMCPPFCRMRHENVGWQKWKF